ncbi:hypothetical protein PDESU_02590 [Pontiella desulfatans]|uniref:Uncharacterized protein n=1 Tax=Pontiella desulfatans TaxID=2750659 RepID=A0A6C2U2A6_PONDE|nr:hypothetical protein [Pontiella desulfatans]VGO14033.1 hypothetical protein PDESU_02590 [Pontiella desulfatans]
MIQLNDHKKSKLDMKAMISDLLKGTLAEAQRSQSQPEYLYSAFSAPLRGINRISRLRSLFGCFSVMLVCGCGASSDDGWEYLDNGTLKIGVDRSRGACIGYFGESKTGRNLLNHYDEGRFVQ